ncbi:MAG: GIY-YIG nuclease family protein [Nitrosopumilus sp.]|nr:GIY-YIG nuclease family protein [Nitrosopumilus sp.]
MASWSGPVGVDDDSISRHPDVDMAGVYVISEPSNGSFKAVYVGQGSPIKDRIDAHGRDSEKNDRLRNLFNNKRSSIRFFYLVEGNAGRRDDFEHTLFNKYGGFEHLFNDIEPPGDEVSMDFPPELRVPLR